MAGACLLDGCMNRSYHIGRHLHLTCHTHPHIHTHTCTGASCGPESEGELDALMAALNFLRFLLLKDPRPGQAGGASSSNVTGLWSPPTLHTTLGQLRALEGNVAKASASASSFRLHMLAEVLSLVVPPLAAEAEGAMEMVDG